MSAATLARLLLVPAAVWLASLAARRWGHRVSGYLGGMPMIGGPITLFLALDYGLPFAAQSATYTLAIIAAQCAHLVVFAHVARRVKWPVALLAGWSAFACAALAIASMAPSLPVAALLAAGGLASAQFLLPHPQHEATLPAVPRAELYLRLVAALVLAAAILWSAARFGPVVSGVMLSLPVTGSIMPPFTLALYGADSVARLMRGFAVGLTGFASFFLVVACSPGDITATFALGVVAALAALFVASRLPAIRSRR